MFKGTADNPEGAFSSRVAALGGNDNAFTTDDVTVYHQTIVKEHLDLMMQFEADRMANLQITDAVVLPERQVILEERRSRTGNSPGAQLGEAMSAALYQNSHYGIPTIGWAHEMATLGRDDAVAFYDRYYTPNNAVLVVAGDVDEATVRALAESTYGKVPRRAEPPPRLRLSEPLPVAARTVTRADPRVTEPSLSRLYLAPSVVTADPAESAALDVLAEILGGSSASRLYRKLVIEEAIAISAGAGYFGMQLGDAAFSINAMPRNGTALSDLEKRIDAIVAELRDGGVTEEEVRRATHGVYAAAVYAEDNPASLANSFGQALALGQTIADVQQRPDRLAAVTVADVNAVARKYLDIRRSVTGYLVNGPDESRW
jgi:zinc protease